MSFRAALLRLCVALVILGSRSVVAQERPADGAGLATPADAVQVPPAPAPSAPAPQLVLIPPPDPWAEYIRAQQIVRLRIKADVLRHSNRSALAPGLVLGVGLTSVIVGGVVFARAFNADEYSAAKDRVGLVMITVGSALTVIGASLLAVRIARGLRLQRVERALRALNDH
jgi:hypothetical protein